MVEIDIVHYSNMMMAYSFTIGVLFMLASEKIGYYAGALTGNKAGAVARYTRVAVLTFGICVAALYGTLFAIFQWTMATR